MSLIRARAFLALTAVQVVLVAGMLAWSAAAARARTAEEIPRKQELVRRLELTDLAIWTEARYSRHPSQADFFAPFQDGPSSLDHFPAGSVVAAPDRGSEGRAD
jgi:hypothetical protein